MELFDGLFLTLACPKCNYGMEVELLAVRLEATVFCPCCKVTVQLVDADASVHGSQNEIQAALKDFESQLKDLNRTIRFKI